MDVPNRLLRSLTDNRNKMTSSIRRPSLNTPYTVFSVNPYSSNLLDVIKKKRLDLVSKYRLNVPNRDKFPKFKTYHTDVKRDGDSVSEFSDAGVFSLNRRACWSNRSIHTPVPQRKLSLPRVRQESCLKRVSMDAKQAWQQHQYKPVIKNRKRIADFMTQSDKSISADKVIALHAYLDSIGKLSEIAGDKKSKRVKSSVDKSIISDAEMKNLHSYLDSAVDTSTFDQLRDSVSMQYDNESQKQHRCDSEFLMRQSLKGTTPTDTINTDNSVPDPLQLAFSGHSKSGTAKATASFGTVNDSVDSSGLYPQAESTQHRSKSSFAARDKNRKTKADTPKSLQPKRSLPSPAFSACTSTFSGCTTSGGLNLSGKDSREMKFDPAATLANNYLRLSPVNVETLENMCLERGFEPELHVNSSPEKYDPLLVDVFSELRGNNSYLAGDSTTST